MVDQSGLSARALMKQQSFIWRRVIVGLALISVSLLSNLLLLMPASAADGRPEIYTLIDPNTIEASGGYFVDIKYKLIKQPNGSFKGGVHIPEYDYPFFDCVFDLIVNPDDNDPTKGVLEFEGGHNCTSPPRTFKWSPVAIIRPGDPTGVDSSGFGAGPAGAANPAAPGEVVPTCDAGPFTWLLCPFITVAQSGIAVLQGWVQDVLVVTPFDTNAPLYSAWSAFRNLADVFFVLIFFVIIFGTGLGMDNYTVKKMLPRLIAAAILVQFSYIISSIAVDISNVLGLGISQLIAASLPADGSLNQGPSGTMQIMGPIIALGTVGAAGGTIVAIGAFVPVLLAIVSALISMIAVFVTLEIRLILINFLIVISPFAFVFWVLPNTEKYFKMWWEFFTKLLLMFPIIMLLFTAANLFNQITINTTPGDFDGDIAKKIIASIIPILVFFLVPATFKLAGSALSMGHGLVSGAAGSSNRGLAGAFWGKEQQEASRLKGQRKLMDLRDQGKGGLLKQRLASSRSGFGFAKGFGQSKLLKGQRVDQALNKTASDLAEAEAYQQYHTKNGERQYNYGETQANRKAAELDKLLDQNASQAFLNQDVQVPDAQGKINTLKIKDVDLDPAGIKALQQKIQTAVENGDNAVAVAAMTKLSQSQGGENALQELRMGGNTANGIRPVFGGGDDKIAADHLKDVWNKGTANAKSPDFRKPPQNAWSDLSQEDIASMSGKQVNRALEYYNRNPTNTKAQEAAKQFSDNFQKVLANPNIAGKINPEAISAVNEYQWARDKSNNVLVGTPHPERTIYSGSTPYQAAAQAANSYVRPGSATPPPAQPTPAPQPTVNVNVQPTQPTIVTAPRAGTTFQQPAPGALYVPRSYQPPTPNPHPPKIDPAVEEHRDDQVGDDRSIN